MRNRYDRNYIVIHAPIAERRGRTFERKLDAAEGRGFVVVGHPTFTPNRIGAELGIMFGTVLMRRTTKRKPKPKV